MTVIHSVGPRAEDAGTQNSQPLLQNFYFIAAAVIVFILVILRIIVLRRRNRSLSDFFRVDHGSRPSYGSYPPHESNCESLYHGIQLAPLPAAYRPDRRVRAADIDAHGRRFGPAGEELGGKEALPAYDNVDRPPKYVEAGWLHGGPPPPTEQPAAPPLPEGEQSGMAHPSSADEGGSMDHQVNDTHTVPGVAPVGSEAPLVSPQGPSDPSRLV